MKALLGAMALLPLTPWIPVNSGEVFRTDINPALLYWQATAEWPTLAESDHGYLFTNEWRGRALDDRFGKLIGVYNDSFKLIRRAAHSQVKCDWGYDLSDGPELLLPGLAKAKAAAQVARLRTLWHLQQGNQAAARDELIATFVLGRNISTDGILISALVQFAIENIVTGVIAENVHQFQPETLKEIVAGIAVAPPRGTVAQCIPAERHSFAGWLLRKLDHFQASSTNDQQVVDRMREVMRKSFSSGDNSDPSLADRIINAAGGTSSGLANYINELWPLYDEADVLMTLPHGDFVQRMKAFNEKIENHPNLLVGVFFPVFEKCRGKEFAAQVTLAMLQAGIEFRVSGPAALERVQDPIFGEPFGFSRFVIDGVDRGFMLTSKLTTRDFPESLVFIETPGPAVHVIGKNAGKKSQ